MTKLAYPSGLTIHYVYDAQMRCVESWGDHPGGTPDPALDPEAPSMLADGVTKSKGLYHVKLVFQDDFREVISATEVQRFVTSDDGESVAKAVGNGAVTTRTYDEADNETSRTDGNGATTRYEYDRGGRLIAEEDPLGGVVRLIRDAAGAVMEMVDPAGGVVSVTRDDRMFVETVRDQRGGLTAYVWDDRGLMREQIHSNGASSKYVSDGHGNLAEATLPNGAVWRYRHDWWGRVTERIDPLGNSTEYRWSPAGRLVAFRERDGGWTMVQRDSMGNPVEVILPDGSVERRRWGGIHWMIEETSPGGVTTRGGYDQDGQLIRLVNGRGDSMRLHWALEGPPRTA
jgi:YD repeat-containing protein